MRDTSFRFEQEITHNNENLIGTQNKTLNKLFLLLDFSDFVILKKHVMYLVNHIHFLLYQWRNLISMSTGECMRQK